VDAGLRRQILHRLGTDRAPFPELVTALESYHIIVGSVTTAALCSAIADPVEQPGLVLAWGLVALLLH